LREELTALCSSFELAGSALRDIGCVQHVFLECHDKTRDILTQFLVESAALSVAGGCTGIILGIVASAIISRLASWNTVVSIGVVALAVFFSALVGSASVIILPQKLPVLTRLQLCALSRGLCNAVSRSRFYFVCMDSR
jgi:hypothetical protein